MNFYYHINNGFKKIEFGVFILLSLVFIVASKINGPAVNGISMSVVGFSAPIVRIISSPFNKIVDFFSNLNELLNAKSNNKLLKDENEKLKSLYIKALNINQENKELRDLVKFVGMRSSKYHAARFIGYSHRINSNSAFIDAGSEAGIKMGNVVTGKYSLIGRIVQVGGGKSRIMLPTDINSRIPIITSKSRIRGVLAGNNTDLMEILYLDRNHHISVGDMVFTSGDGDYLPPGILIGVVKKVNQDYVAVKMVENINNLNIVAVIEY